METTEVRKCIFNHLIVPLLVLQPCLNGNTRHMHEHRNVNIINSEHSFEQVWTKINGLTSFVGWQTVGLIVVNSIEY